MGALGSLLSSFCRSVNLNSQQVYYEVIPQGEQWHITEFVGSANPNQDTHAKLIWDMGGAGEELICVVYGTNSIKLDEIFVGNGTKRLAVVLRNDSLGAEFLFGQWRGTRESV